MHRLVALFVLGLVVAAHPAQKPGLPNIVVFLADDLGWGDLACYGHPDIKTPHLDAFAKQGMRFTQCYSASSVCSPSRSAILTGRTPYRNGVFTWLPNNVHVHLRQSEISIATLLKKRGYATCHAGKWHLNGKFNSKAQPQPNDHGYDWWLATQNNAAPSHKNPRNFVRNGEPIGPTQGFSAILVAQEASTWLRKHRDKSKPFFLSVWTHEPHLPIESDPKFMRHYADKDAGTQQHHGNVTQTDQAFGNLMKTLDELGMAENTLVVFTSDNGPEGKGNSGRTRGSTGGLRGRKRAMYEGGIRVPGIFRWPGRIGAGTENATPIIGSDLFTTICAATGIEAPKDRTIDGADLLPLFAGESIERKQPLYWRWYGAPHGLHMALRVGDHKILASEDQSRHELYDIAKDPREQNELSEARPELFAKLKARLKQHNAAVEAEGPDWWQGYGRRRNRGRAGPIGKGVDKVGLFAVVKGGTITKGGLGFEFEAQGEAFALLAFKKPRRGKFSIATTYRTSSQGNTKNAFLVIGDKPANRRLIKIGTAIGMGAHAAFQGGWGNVQSNKKPARFAKGAKFEVVAKVDLDAHELRAVVNGTEFTYALPKNLKQVGYYGFYVKGTKSTFGPIQTIGGDE